ncbi:unnamed protein product [Vitrella brassicaformis CCMP3155]|uniref:MPN domain-containing protein n=2 Tax=Vitrella brassicaformis TaxID=1169539 RepID=A0A0G4FNX4_VITBC|nr:unnamed protein product [Vitrella brassicaformis CCMP3155]|eukprot:CEM15767.1 unnamed protein product [Vitrella brassicaformis CCMP3155]
MADKKESGLASASGKGGGAGVPSKTQTSLEGLVTDKQVVVHPLVLLSVVDHYNRVATGTNKRVVGTLLGELHSDGKIHVTNSYAVPFEEDPRDPSVWFVDHNYHENMFLMFKKVNAKERVVGWYSTGPKIRPADLEIHEIYRRYISQPVYVIVDPKYKEEQLPTDAYMSFEEASADKVFRRKFVHIPSTIDAYEAEEVGVEHLLRDIKNASTSTLATRVADKLSSLKVMISKLNDISDYIQDVIDDKLPANPKLLYNFQDIFNLLPDLDNEQLVQAFSIETNDMMLSLYLGSVIRASMALHNLINNKVENKRKAEQAELEKEKKKRDAEKKEAKDKEGAEGEASGAGGGEEDKTKMETDEGGADNKEGGKGNKGAGGGGADKKG